MGRGRAVSEVRMVDMLICEDASGHEVRRLAHVTGSQVIENIRAMRTAWPEIVDAEIKGEPTPLFSLSPRERIEEAHGIWELEVVRVAALAEAAARLTDARRLRPLLVAARAAERAAFHYWQVISAGALKELVP